MQLGLCFFFQAEDGIRDLVRSRGLGDVYKRQAKNNRTPRIQMVVVVARFMSVIHREQRKCMEVR